MGYSISEATHQKIESNRREGRLCGGPTSARHHCTTRATTRVTQECWTYEVGQGPATTSDLAMCTRHARLFPVGYRGRNFIVRRVERI